MNYPGHIFQNGTIDAVSITAIQAQLEVKGCGPVPLTGIYDADTENAVRLFQARFADLHGNPLIVDGVIGPVTWASLFGTITVTSVTNPPNVLLSAVLDVARSQIGVMEAPPGKNTGPTVNLYLAAVGVPPGNAWCVAFLYWCFEKACINLGRQNPMIKTGGVMNSWNKATCRKIPAVQAQVNTSLVLPGQIFIHNSGGGLGHTGIIEKIEGGLLTSIEGNTNNDGSREGIGVFRRTSRRINWVNEGFLEYS